MSQDDQRASDLHEGERSSDEQFDDEQFDDERSGSGAGEYLTINRANWDERAPIHETSPDYDRERFLRDPAAISDVVAFDRPRLGDLTGQRAVHLQCHIGTDTLSLARLGAQVVGLDLSPASLAAARRLAADTGTAIPFVESDVYGAPEALAEHGPFDLVYTGIGAIGWLPSIDRWAQTVAALLRPGGRLFIREGHPVLWSLDDPRRTASSPSSTPTTRPPKASPGTTRAPTPLPQRAARPRSRARAPRSGTTGSARSSPR